MKTPEPLLFVVCSSDEETRAEIAERLQATGEIRVVASVAQDRMEAALHEREVDGMYVDLGDTAEKTLDAIEALGEPRPALLFGAPQEDAGLILRALRLGALGFFPGHRMEAELPRVAESIRALAGRARRTSRPGALVAVVGAKGGVGSTTLACQLGASLALRHRSVALLDLNLHGGDVALYFDVQPAHSLAEVAARAEELDSSFVMTLAVRHASGVAIVAAPRRIEDAETLESHHIERTAALLRTEFDWVIADLPRITDEVALQTMDTADQILLVTSLEIASLARTRQYLDLLSRLGHDDSRVRVIVNRHVSSSPFGSGDLENALGRRPDALIPNDPRSVLACVEGGKLIAEVDPRGAVAKAFSDLTADLHTWCDVAIEESKPAPLRSRILRFLGRQ